MSDQPISKPRAETWENEGGSLRPAVSAEALGVTTISTETYAVGEYRYTNLSDAMAQGRRMQAEGSGS
jgi:hypothetical protein